MRECAGVGAIVARSAHQSPENLLRALLKGGAGNLAAVDCGIDKIDVAMVIGRMDVIGGVNLFHLIFAVAPVACDKALVAPLAADYSAQKVGIFACGNAVDYVV